MSSPVKRSLKETHPDLAKEWHPTQNSNLRPEDVVAGTHKKIWWKCDQGPDHEWEARASERSRGTGCPYCAGRRPSVTNSVASNRELAKQWHPTKNGKLKPEELVDGTYTKIWWKCEQGPDHEWRTTGRHRKDGNGCPYCSGYRVSVTNSVASNRELAKQWHPTKNGDLRPEDVVAGTHKKIWWKCEQGSDHEWKASGNKRLYGGGGCPSCSGRKASILNNLTNRHDLLQQWCSVKNINLKPEDITLGSTKIVWWKCDQGPDHEWQARVDNRVRGKGCPYCAGKRASITNNAASDPVLSKQWHPTKNGSLRPEDVVAGTKKKIWWKCDKVEKHEWRATGSNRTRGNGCPDCAESGYKANKAGYLYIIKGEKWGKVGITNTIKSRLNYLRTKGLFISTVLVVEFEDGSMPQMLEKEILGFIAGRTTERAPAGTDGYTESFPLLMLEDVVAELRRALSVMSADCAKRSEPLHYRYINEQE